MFQRNLFVTQNTLFVNQMTQNTLFYSIYHKIRAWRIWSWVNLRLENIKQNVSPEGNEIGCFGFGNKNYIRFFWRLNFPARDFPPLNGDFWNLLQKIDILPFWDCLTSILEVKKTEWMILRQRNASSNVIYSPDLSLGCVISADRYIFETATDLVNYSRLSHICPCVFAIMKYHHRWR